MRVVFHPNPTEAAKLGAVIDKYQVTLLVGTPTFLAGIVNAAQTNQLASLRIAVTGAEQCPSRVYDALAERCPGTTVIEGYGITECSPIVSVNRPGQEERATIGQPLPSVEIAIVEPTTLRPVAMGERGMLLARGPSIFGGYLQYSGESPFVQYNHQTWYRTEDLVRMNERGNLEFCGRMKRFIKLGGEMISLPAIESVLEEALTDTNEAGPSLAVEATPGEHAELVLFATSDLERDRINRHLRDAGLSPLHNIRQIRRLDSIPLLGSGKTDYRALKALLANG
jgi:long-chain-fatty-acid--[acyl-carrier-protein] ligase